MNENLSIRKACISDFNQINELFWQSDLFHHNNESYIYEKTDEGHRTKEYFESIICEENSIFIVLVIETKIIGFLYAYEEIRGKLPFHKKRKYMVLDNIVINEKYQNMGYGQKLMNYFVKYSREKQYKDIVLNVFCFNKNAIKLYENNGFEKLSQNMILKL